MSTLCIAMRSKRSTSEVSVAILVSESSDSLWSQLVTYDDPLFIPLSCQCTLIKKSQASMN